MNNYTVYIHQNKINNKKYIGITKQRPEKRWRNGEGYKSSPHFYSSIKKYGWDNFDHIILFTNFSENEAKTKEIELIKSYNTMDNKFGYNCTKGGDGVTGRKMTQKQIEKLRLINTGRKASSETKEKLRKAMTGRIMSDEWKNRISESHKGDKNPSAKPIVQLNSNYELIKEFGCAVYAQSELGIFVSHINAVCLRREKSAGGFIFMFKDDYENNKKLLENKSAKIHKHKTPVNQFNLNGELIKTFESIKQATKELRIEKSSIIKVCKGKQKTAGGFTWSYAD